MHSIEITSPGTEITELDYCVDTTSSISANCADENSILDINQGAVKVFPNPFSSKFTISDLPKEASLIRVMGLSGKLLMQQNTNQNSIQINLANLSTGLYLLTVQTSDKIIQQTVLKK